MKLLAGAEPLTSGDYRLGHNAEPNYFAQDQYRELDQESTLLDDLAGVAPRWTLTQLRTLLGCFLFRDDDVHKRIRILSGGERNRYALARLLVSPSNFLLLDEPTNHLDMRAKDVLLEALEGYTGTVVFVSHDRYFIDGLATRVFEVADGRVTPYAGNYEDFLRQKAGRPPQPETEKASPEAPARAPRPAKAAPRKKRLNPIKARRMRERCREIEEEAPRFEAAIAECEQELAVFRGAEQARELTERLERHRSDLEALLAEWEELTESLDGQR
jgi:ATP-binding cassette subfamily F protein 3